MWKCAGLGSAYGKDSFGESRFSRVYVRATALGRIWGVLRFGADVGQARQQQVIDARRVHNETAWSDGSILLVESKFAAREPAALWGRRHCPIARGGTLKTYIIFPGSWFWVGCGAF